MDEAPRTSVAFGCLIRVLPFFLVVVVVGVVVVVAVLLLLLVFVVDYQILSRL